jgi:hypothetical protein
MITNLTGSYELRNIALLHDKANRNDPRRVFYRAMLQHSTYEGYLAAVGTVAVEVLCYKAGPITGRMEILYCRRNGWIADVA